MSRYAHPAGPRHADVLPEEHPPIPPHSLVELDEKVWPRTARRVDGEITIGGVAVSELAREYGTPLFVLDEEDFRARARDYRLAFGDAEADVYYAGKALLTKAVARWVHEEGLKLDVCSGGELAVALAAGFPPERIGMHGNNKSEAELARAIEVGVGRIIVDSFDEIDRLERLAAAQGRVPRVLVRVTTGVEAHTHEFVATAHDDQKFGLALSTGAAATAVRRLLACDHVELVGLHSHIGSQIFDTAGFEVAARRLSAFLTEIHREHGIVLPELDLGGGLGIAYLPGDRPLEPKEIADSLLTIVRRECEAHGLPMPRIAVEPGRAIAGPCGVTVYEVGTIKDVEGIRTYVSVDGGMSDNIRTALYEAEYTCALASRAGEGAPMLSRLVGKHCESGDIVVRDLYLPDDLRTGDLVAVAATGAYCHSMASNYNHLPRPAVVAVRDGSARVLVRRETEDDLLRLDVG
ncbi:diaminopimelate decarboxylase [Marinactinospora thermotolerans]|uniref:Diaminopimelate decarboxylase n=1 Tax=Marinactinospora thermotolerans DSM 45154 TaxID=1122192 RepID=A0A1T4QA01_9ACTN|nr:diaminopimelate decarboxylase [Marinactinospora thermotolerans]SKA00620.1 diaminopimelate decarboxylase [Marinactinospora thermotolerans DSM 45154]